MAAAPRRTSTFGEAGPLGADKSPDPTVPQPDGVDGGGEEGEELFGEVCSKDFLGFGFGGRSYGDQLLDAVKKTKQHCAVRVRVRSLAPSGVAVVWVQHDFAFLGGSLGCAEGERVARAFELATERRLCVVVACRTGGARMQEGTLSLMQMAKVSVAVAAHRRAGLPFVSVLEDPTYGGVSASYAMQADVKVAVAGARIGFAGPGVILNTMFDADEANYDAACPAEFQSAEYCLRQGAVDVVAADAAELAKTVHDVAACLAALGRWRASAAALAAVGRRTSAATPDYTASRALDRPQYEDLRDLLFADFVELAGDGRVGRDACLSGARDVPGAARLAGQSEAIATNLTAMAGLAVPIITVVLGEGGSGGALGIAMGNRVAMLSQAYYGVISPEAPRRRRRAVAVPGLARPARRSDGPAAPAVEPPKAVENAKTVLDRSGPEAMAAWVRSQSRVLVTDTTMRDAHQSLLATRVRTLDLVRGARVASALLPDAFSFECWGGATFDVSYRFLKEDPWDRLRALRAAAPNVCTQMLIRGANAVGYTSYPDNVVTEFVRLAALNGMDVFRIFDCFNDVGQMRTCVDAVRAAGKVAEVCVCYTSDCLASDVYDVAYYAGVAAEAAAAGAHLIGIKDMAGLLKPAAAAPLLAAIRGVCDLPVHFHTHCTSSASVAVALEMTRAGCDVVDFATAAMADLTSQPSLNAFCAAMEGLERAPGIDYMRLEPYDVYWAKVRAMYAPFETGMLAGSARVFDHEIPGGQYANLFVQCQSMGLADRWEEVLDAYRDVNKLFGDVVKVTPSSKCVGDLALYLVTRKMTAADVLDGSKTLDYPDSVVGLMEGRLGFPHRGFPADVQQAILGDRKPLTTRPTAPAPSPGDDPRVVSAMKMEVAVKCHRAGTLALKVDAGAKVVEGALLATINQTSGARARSRYTHVVVDEVHERSSDVDLLLLVLKRAVGRGAAPASC
ncbi:CoA carboxylase [Aureococcus anophagefferens]|uniref:Acetyl-coenzyme A carboxylase carboxyl transferase subunits beta/alpha n=1 Tax=Aureococcus anophagefferens TaxID=44056 RepID=A0ABR1FSL0_AURAN